MATAGMRIHLHSCADFSQNTRVGDGGWSLPSSGNAPAEDTSAAAPYESPNTAAVVVSNLWEALHEVDVKLADKQADISSPLYSAKTFEELGLYSFPRKHTYYLSCIGMRTC